MNGIVFVHILLVFCTLCSCTDTFRIWLRNLDTYGALISLAGNYWSAGDTVSAKTILNGIAGVYSLTEDQADDLQDVKNLFGQLYGKNIYNLSQNVIDDLEVFAAADPAG